MKLTVFARDFQINNVVMVNYLPTYSCFLSSLVSINFFANYSKLLTQNLLQAISIENKRVMIRYYMYIHIIVIDIQI